MATSECPVEPALPPGGEKSRGEVYEGIAFTFCKAATIILLTQKYALPVAAGLTALFYVLAEVHGKRDTRCVLRSPRLIALLWGTVSLVSLWRLLLFPAP